MFDQIKKLGSAWHVKYKMSAHGISVCDSMHRLIVKRPDLSSGKMLRPALGQKVCPIVGDDRDMYTKWFEPGWIEINVGSRYA
jgi:hypothetical protein